MCHYLGVLWIVFSVCVLQLLHRSARSYANGTLSPMRGISLSLYPPIPKDSQRTATYGYWQLNVKSDAWSHEKDRLDWLLDLTRWAIVIFWVPKMTSARIKIVNNTTKCQQQQTIPEPPYPRLSLTRFANSYHNDSHLTNRLPNTLANKWYLLPLQWQMKVIWILLG